MSDTSAFKDGFNKANLKLLRAMLDVALKDLDPQLEVTPGNITFSEGSCSLKLEFQVKGKMGTEETMAIQYATMYGLDPALRPDIPRIGVSRLVKYSSRSSEYPWVIENAEGKRYKFKEADANRYFKKA
jgi:hypothetical protein